MFIIQDLCLFLQPPVFTHFLDYVTELQTLTSNVIDHIKGLEIILTALKLEELSLKDTLHLQVRDSLCKHPGPQGFPFGVGNIGENLNGGGIKTLKQLLWSE